MPAPPRVVSSVPALRRALAGLRRRGTTMALVPTMGALHQGHLSLIRLAGRRGRKVVVSIFVNPTQFAPNEDFSTYPRNLKHDLAMLAPAGVALVWAPDVAVMYPDGFATRIAPEGPAKAGLEDAFRPHFFGGVATVVAKLLIQCAPDIAVFGEKDYQQLKVITRLATDLDLPVKIVGAPIVRERDGLAMSSRNAYLSGTQRAVAATLYRVLKDCARRIAEGEPIARVLDEGGAEIEAAGFQLDYLEARHAESLAKVERKQDGPLRLLVAARLGKTRLIDNLAV
ncbi:MAG: pantoate--beta-alanine ligase [Hyphomicrobiales bacterium]|nr:pantoate--beta-alanine ligase [Hyphomicrobiales bacterium]